MFLLEVEDADLRTSLAGYLVFKVPGIVATERAGGVRIVIDADLGPAAQRRLIDRLLWAWQVEQQLDPRVRVHVTEKPDAGARSPSDRRSPATPAGLARTPAAATPSEAHPLVEAGRQPPVATAGGLM